MFGGYISRDYKNYYYIFCGRVIYHVARRSSSPLCTLSPRSPLSQQHSQTDGHIHARGMGEYKINKTCFLLFIPAGAQHNTLLQSTHNNTGLRQTHIGIINIPGFSDRYTAAAAAEWAQCSSYAVGHDYQAEKRMTPDCVPAPPAFHTQYTPEIIGHSI
jgi:hypothetical protein